MKRNYLLAAILVVTLLLSLGIGSFMAASAQVFDTPTVKPTLKATNTPEAKPTNTPVNKYIL